MKNERYDLSKEFVISEEVSNKYDQTKERTVGYRKARAIFGTGIVFAIIGVRLLMNLTDEPVDSLLGMIIFSVIAIVIGVILLIIGSKKTKIFHDKSKGMNIVRDYLDDCIAPIVSQIDSDVKLTETITSGGKFLPYADISEYSDLDSLQKLFQEKYVLPYFNHSLETNVCISTLETNEQGFLYVNAKGISKTTDSDGNTHYTTVFEGPIVVVRTKLKTRCDVSLYTSGKTLIRKKETSGGYKKIKNTIDAENDAFNEAFQVTADETSQAFYILSPLVMENLLKIKERYGKFGLNVHNEYLVFGFNRKKEPISRPLAMPETVKEAKNLSLERSMKEVAEMLELAYSCKDAIDLNLPDQMSKMTE